VLLYQINNSDHTCLGYEQFIQLLKAFQFWSLLTMAYFDCSFVFQEYSYEVILLNNLLNSCTLMLILVGECWWDLLKFFFIILLVNYSIHVCWLQVIAGASNATVLPHASHSVVGPKVIQLVQAAQCNTAANVQSNPTWASVGARKRPNEALDSYSSDRWTWYSFVLLLACQKRSKLCVFSIVVQ